ncbi:uncharacterized protein BKA55DRAFT_577403 [Fusarium redolens]|uniref:Uncharacterized protein n=1 Tax=Fusarium redolens TaxID=48865 RepID=A0A9P9GK20_FUSRE|nr:uncharacterized protein BKA55DRAFT_577403 [Fusarium redolens]KAH7240366.1 hypothetical protein BKA55DRAFT_577403 [Fusarium redolens]
MPPCLHRLALPLWKKNPEGIDGTSDHNISTYLIDSSLLTVCQESRSLMKRVFETNDTSRMGFPRSRTGYYFSGGAPLHITIYLQTDLIILQFDGMINFNWDFLGDLFLHQRGFNIGIEYNQKWAIEPYEQDEDEDEDDDSISLAFHKLFELAEEWVILGIWLIDHNLKRRKGSPSQKDSVKSGFTSPHLSKPFYTNDRKFLKVNLEQGEECLDHWQYLKPMHEGDYQKSSLYFADRLRQRVYDFAVRDHGDAHHFSCYSGLLGWDDL